ncbi:hypothetical protein ACFE04_002088 [Oxalis oulophora]
MKIPRPHVDEKDKRYATDACTVRIMKSHRVLGHQQLVMECVEHLSRVFKRKGTKNLALEVPGLAEKRPSLVHGDHVFVKLALGNGGSGTVFQGYINRVEADEVLLTFAEEFHISHMNRNLYDVQFAYSRVNMRRLYHAVYATTNQRHCVEMIIDCHGAPPFAIYGPPDTGKTSTLVDSCIIDFGGFLYVLLQIVLLQIVLQIISSRN